MPSAQQPRYRFPWRKDNDFRLLVDGDHFIPVMLEAIDNASEQVLLEMYLFESGHLAGLFIDALCSAVQRGVNVCVMLDDYGARALLKHDRNRLTASGVHLTFFNPLRYGKLRRNLFRDHRKVLVVDNTVAFTGGLGITDEFDPAAGTRHYWHETVVEIKGPVLQDWRALFIDNWNRWSQEKLGHATSASPRVQNGALGRVTCTGGAARAEIKASFLKRIHQAEHRVWMATAYFVPSWKLLRALCRAASTDCDVRLLLPGKHTDHPAIRHAGRRYYSRLLRHGVRIFEYQPRFLHEKMLLCDQWVSIGSSNIDRWNLRWNLEANQEIDDQTFAQEVSEQFEKDFSHSKEYVYDKWRHRAWYQRWREKLWGWVDLWLERKGQKKK